MDKQPDSPGQGLHPLSIHSLSPSIQLLCHLHKLSPAHYDGTYSSHGHAVPAMQFRIVRWLPRLPPPCSVLRPQLLTVLASRLETQTHMMALILPSSAPSYRNTSWFLLGTHVRRHVRTPSRPGSAPADGTFETSMGSFHVCQVS